MRHFHSLFTLLGFFEVMGFSIETKSHYQSCQLKNVNLASIDSIRAPGNMGSCDTSKQCPGEGGPRSSLYKEACSRQYKPNSIKNAIRYRFQIKAKYYRNLTVLEKASFIQNIVTHPSLPG